eukprot:gene12247-5832_t
MGKIQVTIIEASDLKKSDPYCLVQIEKEKKKTKIIKDTENPTWKETMNLEASNNAEILLIEVIDNNPFSQETLGKCEYNLKDLNQLEMKREWLDLIPSGKVFIEIVAKGKLYPIELKMKLKLDDKKNEVFEKIIIKDVKLENDSFYDCSVFKSNEIYQVEIEKQKTIDETILKKEWIELDFDQSNKIPIIEFKDFLENRYKSVIEKMNKEDGIPLKLELEYYSSTIEATRNLKEKFINFSEFSLFMENIIKF